MGHTFLCVLQFFLLNTLFHCGHAEDAVLTLEPNWSRYFTGDSVTFTCDMKEGENTDWEIRFTKDGEKIQRNRSDPTLILQPLYTGHSGGYQCSGRHIRSNDTKISNTITLSVSYSNSVSVSLQLDWTQMIRGDITVRCEIQGGGDTQWVYEWKTPSEPTRTQRTDTKYWTVRESEFSSGGYRCRGTNTRDSYSATQWSEAAALTVSDAVLTLDPSRSSYFTGESVTFTCDMKDNKHTDWKTRLIKDGGEISSHTRHTIKPLSTGDSGRFQCFGLHKTTNHIKTSETIYLTVSEKPKAQLRADDRVIPVGGRVTLSCSVDESKSWRYDWFRRTSASPAAQIRRNSESNSVTITDGGVYHCRGKRGGGGNQVYYTHNSDSVTVEETVSNKAVVKRQHDWPEMFRGENITLTCEIQAGGDTEWEYEWTKGSSGPTLHQSKRWVFTASPSSSGGYKCKGRQKRKIYSSTAWSEPLRLVTASEPKAELTSDQTEVPVGGSVTLSCSVTSSAGWKYYWYRGDKSSEVLNTQDGETSVSQEGLYWCRGGRGDAVYYTQYSDSVRINRNVGNKVVVTLHPNWTQLFRGDTITVRCEIEDTGDTEWEYEWKTPTSIKPQHNEFNIRSASPSFSGGYKCRGRMRNAQHITTEWSQSISLTVSHNKAQCVLRASPSWLSPGASVALKCEVEPPSAGWRFYWYQTVPDGSHSYRYELLPASDHGTEQGSYMVHGQTHTAGYVCRAGRGEPAYYTDYSKAAFVWSGDVGPSASLTVSPDRVQHFTSDSVSLSCEGNSAEWRVRRFPEGGFLSSCSNWTTTGSRCDINTAQSGSAVFWCESGSGHFSNSLNITVHGGDIILVSPVLPVTQGTAVTLGCRSRTQRVVSTVFFYQNDQLIQNDTRAELNISAASESHQGFYSCEVKQQSSRTLTSAKSWMSVKLVSRPDSSSLIVGLVCGFTLMLLLLLFFLCRKSKGSCYFRCQTTSQSSATSHMTNHDGGPDQKHDALLQGASSDVTYSEIELKKNVTKDKRREAEEASVYSGSAAGDSVTYAQVKVPIEGKAKKPKGKSGGAAADECVYSEVK